MMDPYLPSRYLIPKKHLIAWYISDAFLCTSDPWKAITAIDQDRLAANSDLQLK